MMSWLTNIWDWITGKSSKVEAIRQVTAAMCGFLPTAETVLNILALNNPALLLAEQIGAAICRAVTPSKTLGLVSELPQVGGVPVEGEWVRR